MGPGNQNMKFGVENKRKRNENFNIKNTYCNPRSSFFIIKIYIHDLIVKS